MLARTFKLTVAFLLILITLSTQVSAQATTSLTLEDFMQERKLGEDKAPVKVIEYSSFTCSHCASFATEALPKIKEELIKTGKVQIIFRDFPLDRFALKEAMMARCAPKENYFDIVEMLFSSQKRLADSADAERFLIQLGSLVGMSEEEFKACTENTEFEKAIVDRLQETQKKYNLNSVPTFIFNDGKKTVMGYQTSEQFKKIVMELTAEKK